MISRLSLSGLNIQKEIYQRDYINRDNILSQNEGRLAYYCMI